MALLLVLPRVRTLLAVAACCTLTSLCSPQTQKSPPAPGQIVDVACASDASQTYALFLPSQYTERTLWPIVYLFDPGGRGKRPVLLYKDVAEKYGFILAGSNNSRNFGSDQSKAVSAIWQDTHERLALDEHRSYASGFSGGARVAGALALSAPSQLTGVIAYGAGYPTSRSGSKDDFPYFFAVGDEDFNWPEVVNIRRDREQQGLRYRVKVFRGGHQWGPPPVMDEALQYLNLKAMQAEDLARDPDFIDRAFETTKAAVATAEAKNDSIAKLNAYRSLVSDFSGLRDVKEFAAKLSALQNAATLKDALKHEREEMQAQFKLEQEITPRIDALAGDSVQDATALRLEIRQQMSSLRDQAKHNKNEAQRLISSRAFSGIFVRAMEDGQGQLETRHFEKAETYFDLMRQVSDDPWPALALADTHAASGNRKLAIKDLQEAVRRGLKDRSLLESDPRLQILRDDSDFKALLASLDQSK